MKGRPPGLSGRLWPVHPKPLPDELLSSWLIRIARGFRTRVNVFCEQVWSEPVWKGDIDVSVAPAVLDELARRTATPYSRVVETTLAAFADRLTGPVPSLFDDADRGKGLRFCPACLREDAVAYYRREWRLSFVTICSRHGTALHQACAACGRMLDVAEVPMDAQSLAVCSVCGQNVFGVAALELHSASTTRLRHLQQRLHRLLD